MAARMAEEPLNFENTSKLDTITRYSFKPAVPQRQLMKLTNLQLILAVTVALAGATLARGQEYIFTTLADGGWLRFFGWHRQRRAVWFSH